MASKGGNICSGIIVIFVVQFIVQFTLGFIYGISLASTGNASDISNINAITQLIVVVGWATGIIVGIVYIKKANEKLDMGYGYSSGYGGNDANSNDYGGGSSPKGKIYCVGIIIIFVVQYVVQFVFGFIYGASLASSGSVSSSDISLNNPIIMLIVAVGWIVGILVGGFYIKKKIDDYEMSYY